MTIDDPGPVPPGETAPRRRRVQLHIWVDDDVEAWVRRRAYECNLSRGKTVEAIIRQARESMSNDPCSSVPIRESRK